MTYHTQNEVRLIRMRRDHCGRYSVNYSYVETRLPQISGARRGRAWYEIDGGPRQQVAFEYKSHSRWFGDQSFRRGSRPPRVRARPLPPRTRKKKKTWWLETSYAGFPLQISRRVSHTRCSSRSSLHRDNTPGARCHAAVRSLVNYYSRYNTIILRNGGGDDRTSARVCSSSSSSSSESINRTSAAAIRLVGRRVYFCVRQAAASSNSSSSSIVVNASAATEIRPAASPQAADATSESAATAAAAAAVDCTVPARYYQSPPPPPPLDAVTHTHTHPLTLTH